MIRALVRATAVVVAGAGCGSLGGDRPPNVLVVTLDTTRVDVVGAYGDPAAPSVTPVLDRLATDAIRFDRAYTVTPLTIPAHSSLFTGLLPPRHGVRDNGDARLSDAATTLAERLSAAGYQTMASVGAEVTSRHWGFAQGFDVFRDPAPGPGNPTAVDRWRVERPADQVVDDAIRWLAAADPERPWFVWVHLYDAHAPYAPPPAYRSLDPYRGEVAFADAQLGRLLAAVRASGEAGEADDGDPATAADDDADRGGLDRTWVTVLADHGESLGEHGEAAHGVLVYDVTTRIPWIVRPPGGVPARSIDAPVSGVDLTPTLLGALGLPAGDVDGFDLSSAITGDWTPDSDRGVYVESRYAYVHYGWAVQRAWVDGRSTLIDSTVRRLFDRSDVPQRRDLAPSEPDRAAALAAALDAYAATLVSPSGGPTLAPAAVSAAPEDRT
ncbi:MAG: sulfatase, partial [Myxococcota bacterium]